MTPTTRNSLMVGGALIVIALLLTCGPIRGIFGTGDAGTSADVATSDATPIAAGWRGTARKYWCSPRRSDDRCSRRIADWFSGHGSCC